MRHARVLEAGPGSTGQEWLSARCEGCERTWEAQGTIQSRAALTRVQKHADRTGHRVAVEHANRR